MRSLIIWTFKLLCAFPKMFNFRRPHASAPARVCDGTSAIIYLFITILLEDGHVDWNPRGDFVIQTEREKYVAVPKWW